MKLLYEHIFSTREQLYEQIMGDLISPNLHSQTIIEFTDMENRVRFLLPEHTLECEIFDLEDNIVVEVHIL